MTQRIFDFDSHAAAFDATVLSCTPDGDRFAVVLDQTAFFPLGGGQQPDTGTLGDAKVLDVRESSRVITHYTDRALTVGTTVHGEINWPQRFRRMQNHSGEHIVSGLIHRLYGLENVGFHMGSEDITIDISGVLTRQQIDEVERLANEAVYRNVAITARYPDAEELASIDYRSKLELTENVRIVTVEGYDDCACCAPHVSRTGEIGVIKLLDFIHYKGGVRIHMLCGADAMDDYRTKFENIQAISNALSVKQADAAKAVDALNAQLGEAKRALGVMRRAYARAMAAQTEAENGMILYFSEDFDADAMREFANTAVEKCSLCAVFSGSDQNGWNYIAASTTLDLRALSKSINAGISGRGGGSTQMIQGRASADEATIRDFFNKMELWDAYYKDGTLANQDLVRGEPIPKGLYHIVCEILVRHVDGEYLLMHRDPGKVDYPDYDEASAGGSALKGENPLDCAKRELWEETGVSGTITPIGQYISRDTLHYNYLCVTDCDKDSIILQEGETTDYRWISEAEFIDFVNSDAMIDLQRIHYHDYLVKMEYLR